MIAISLSKLSMYLLKSRGLSETWTRPDRTRLDQTKLEHPIGDTIHTMSHGHNNMYVLPRAHNVRVEGKEGECNDHAKD